MVNGHPAASRRRFARVSTTLLVALAWAATALPCSQARGAELTASPSSLGTVFAAAQAGDTILLSGGDYGTFGGAMKPGPVTLRARPGAQAKIAVNFAPAANITLDGVTLTYAVIGDSHTHNITIRNADVTGRVVLRTSELRDAGIVLDHNDHHDWDACTDCYEGRVQLAGYTSGHSGVTIQNSEFRGGLSDGIQDSSHGTQILNNTFHDMPLADSGGPHVDAIQLVGTSDTVIRGNFFARVPTAIMAPDGADHLVIEDNVFAATPDGYPYAISLGSDNGTLIRHNTLADGACAFNLRCGIVALGSKPGNPRGRNTVIQDNILGAISITGPATIARQSHNLIREPTRGGHNDIKGLPDYRSGSRPTTYAGHALATGSPGKGNASDGSDRGARVTASRSTKADGPPDRKGRPR